MGLGINDPIADFKFRIAELRNGRKLTTEVHGITRKRKNNEYTFFSYPPQAEKTSLCSSVKNPWLKNKNQNIILNNKSKIPNREFHSEISVRSTSSLPTIPTSLPSSTTGRV
jgi:hypothetical protein